MAASRSADLGAVARMISIKPRNFKTEGVSKNLEKIILFLQMRDMD